LGMMVENGVARVKELAVEKLQVGSREKPTGITLYDEITSQPYCIRMRNGQLVTSSGECREINITRPETLIMLGDPTSEELGSQEGETEPMLGDPTSEELGSQEGETEPMLGDPTSEELGSQEGETEPMLGDPSPEELGSQERQAESQEAIPETAPEVVSEPDSIPEPVVPPVSALTPESSEPVADMASVITSVATDAAGE